MNQLLDYFFWFVQPGSVLTNLDLLFGYLFAGLFILAVVVRIIKQFVLNPVVRKLLGKVFNLASTVSIFGIVWFAFRYEGTPIFARRMWAGLVLLGGLVWIGFIVKYLIFNFTSETRDYERMQVKNKYLPKKS